MDILQIMTSEKWYTIHTTTQSTKELLASISVCLQEQGCSWSCWGNPQLTRFSSRLILGVLRDVCLLLGITRYFSRLLSLEIKTGDDSQILDLIRVRYIKQCWCQVWFIEQRTKNWDFWWWQHCVLCLGDQNIL